MWIFPAAETCGIEIISIEKSEIMLSSKKVFFNKEARLYGIIISPMVRLFIKDARVAINRYTFEAY